MSIIVVANVRCEDLATPAGCFYFFGSSFSFGCIGAIVDQHVVTNATELDRNCSPDATRGASDEGNATGCCTRRTHLVSGFASGLGRHLTERGPESARAST